MVFRFLLRYLANNEKLVHRLSESYPIQQAARLAVSIFNKSKGIIQEHEIKEKFDATKVREFFRRFKTNVKQEIEQAKEEFKRRK